jgi:hypothetical protein
MGKNPPFASKGLNVTTSLIVIAKIPAPFQGPSSEAHRDISFIPHHPITFHQSRLAILKHYPSSWLLYAPSRPSRVYATYESDQSAPTTSRSLWNQIRLQLQKLPTITSVVINSHLALTGKVSAFLLKRHRVVQSWSSVVLVSPNRWKPRTAIHRLPPQRALPLHQRLPPPRLSMLRIFLQPAQPLHLCSRSAPRPRQVVPFSRQDPFP